LEARLAPGGLDELMGVRLVVANVAGIEADTRFEAPAELAEFAPEEERAASRVRRQELDEAFIHSR
jgi:hypothetical protein